MKTEKNSKSDKKNKQKPVRGKEARILPPKKKKSTQRLVDLGKTLPPKKTNIPTSVKKEKTKSQNVPKSILKPPKKKEKAGRTPPPKRRKKTNDKKKGK